MKLVIGSALVMLLAMQANAMAPRPTSVNPYNGVGCTKEYDPVPYTKKDGTVVTAPNPCVAAKWKSEGV